MCVYSNLTILMSLLCQLILFIRITKTIIIMKRFYFLLFFSIGLFSNVYSQDDNQSGDLLNEIANTDQEQLLPSKMIFTQRMLWGQHGLMRHCNKFELTPEKRQNELKIRRGMLVAHQIGGFVTMGGMIAQGIVGAKLYSGDGSLRSTHEGLATLVNTTYFTTAGLALFAPPKMFNERKGYSSIKVHKALAALHFTGMLATNILAGQLESHPELRPYHRAVAFTSFAAFAAAMLIIKF